MRKCWYTFILTISLAGAAVTHVFPGWMDHAVLRSGSYLQGKSIAYAKASVPVHGRWTRQKAQKTDLEKGNREKQKTGLFSGSFYRVFLHDIPEMCIFIQEKQAV